ncbi:MAG: ornithine carbamoyltransferase [Ilumatobacteraceae bacterium]
MNALSRRHHLLDIVDHGSDGVRRMIDLAVDLGSAARLPLAGRGVAMLFEKPSNRTRHSMEMAVVQLGGHPIYTRGEEVGLDVRETVEDVTRILAGYHAVIAARVFAHATVERMAAVSVVPVVNMLSDRSHPLQALADVVTMEEAAGPIKGQVVAWIGDYNNVARSLAEAVCLLGGTISLGCPAGHDADDSELARLAGLGGTVRQSESPREAVDGAAFVHTDTWISMGQESEADERREIFGAYRVDADLMSCAASGAWFMHCMPAHRGEEVSADVFDGPSSLVITQGHHRLTASRGALAYLTEGGL